MKPGSSDSSAIQENDTIATNELNNLLQIISGTSAAIENIWDGKHGSQEYFEMLRVSIDRAAKITAHLVTQAGGSNKNIVFHPHLISLPKQEKETTPPAAKRRTLLVVDDEPLALVLTRRILSEVGFEVVTAQSGFRCLDLFRTSPHRFDLVVLDLTMPFMDGEETFERMRSIRPDVAVLLTAGFIGQEQLDRMKRAGIAGYLRKPHAPNELIDNIQAIFGKRKVPLWLHL